MKEATIEELKEMITLCEDCRFCKERGAGVDCPQGYGYLYCTQFRKEVYHTDYCSWGKKI